MTNLIPHSRRADDVGELRQRVEASISDEIASLFDVPPSHTRAPRRIRRFIEIVNVGPEPVLFVSAPN